MPEATPGAGYYSVRRLSPFLGTLQAVSLPEGRAISADGGGWHVELLSTTAVRQPPWGDIGPARAQRRFFSHGVWSRKEGLRARPVNSLLGDQSRHPALGPLQRALEAMPSLPFAPADLTELWLLGDADGLPLVLLRSSTEEQPPAKVFDLSWQPLVADDPGFAQATRRRHTGFGETENPIEALKSLVRRAAGSSPSAQWFRRDALGGGLGLNGARIPADFVGRRLERRAFPELLLRADWSTPPEQALFAAYRTWLAPMFLTLAGLQAETRAQLEEAAVGHADRLYHYRRLLPEVIDRQRMEACLVEAVLRNASS